MLDVLDEFHMYPYEKLMQPIDEWRPPSNIPETSLLVVMVTPHYFGDRYDQTISLGDSVGAPVCIEFSTDTTRAVQADALMFHLPSIERIEEPKKPGQKWIALSMESGFNCPLLKDPEVMSQFDLTMTYRLDADVPVLYPTWHEYGSLLEPSLPIEDKNKIGAPAVYIASNPTVARDSYVAAMMARMRIDSLGACLRNKAVENFVVGRDIWARGGWTDKINVLRRYKFYLAFENSRGVDFVAERLFHAFVAGTVPVYMGAPNVRDFLPAVHSAILVDEFSGPEALTEYLLELDRDDASYLEYLSWKNTGYTDQFKALMDLSSVDPRVRLGLKLAHGCTRECPCGGRLRNTVPP